MLCRSVFEKVWPSFAALSDPKRRHHIMACAIIIVLLVCSASSTLLSCELLLSDLQVVILLLEGVLCDVRSKETCVGLPQEI